MRYSPNSPFVLGWLLLLGVVCVSTGALFARISSTDPLTTAAYRMTFAWILISPFGILKISREWSSIPFRSFLLIGIAGGFLALHFATWIHSLDHTSVANSVCLVTTSSLWTGLIALIFLRKKPSSPLFWISCLLGILGVGILTGYKTGENGINFWGDGMALIGAVCMAVYLLLAQGVKDRISFSSFLLLCYGSSVAFLWLFLWLVQSGPSSVQSSDWIFLIALAIVSQVMGHGIYNLCIRWMDARMVALSLLGEPVGATFLAWMFLHESIGLQQLIGMIILLIALSLPSVRHLQSMKTSIP
ncbi:MAG: DMT family transporter [Verrucomicrobiota bacterium]|nr:DMT family transporter [Verrucomicrobiota bacterium]